MKHFSTVVIVLLLFAGCGKRNTTTVEATTAGPSVLLPVKSRLRGTNIPEVPVLCYHNFSPRNNTDMTLSYNRFCEQIRSLADSGYQTVSPEELYAYLANGGSLPPKPLVISFDDGRLAQYTMAADVLEHYGFTGMFFIMTVTVDKPNYMSCTMLNDLASRGHAIGVHTYDHQMVSHLHGAQWITQLKEPKIFLENAIHDQVDWFAYPFGPWTNQCIRELERDGYRMAFQMDDAQSPAFPLFTVRRLLVSGHWSAATLQQKMKTTFNRPQAGLM